MKFQNVLHNRCDIKVFYGKCLNISSRCTYERGTRIFFLFFLSVFLNRKNSCTYQRMIYKFRGSFEVRRRIINKFRMRASFVSEAETYPFSVNAAFALPVQMNHPSLLLRITRPCTRIPYNRVFEVSKMWKFLNAFKQLSSTVI